MPSAAAGGLQRRPIDLTSQEQQDAARYVPDAIGITPFDLERHATQKNQCESAATSEVGDL